MNNPNSEPHEVTIRLTPAQRSALECAGLDMAEADEPGLLALRDAWSADTLTVTSDTYAAVLDGLTDRCNAEDAQADEQHDAKARGACTALCNLSARLIRLRRPDRMRGDDDGVEYADPRDAR
jgi:hypothetical protein